MVREAEAHAETDKINRERVEAINQAEVRFALLKGPVSREFAHEGEDLVASWKQIWLIFYQTPCVVSKAKPRVVIVSFRRLVIPDSVGFFLAAPKNWPPSAHLAAAWKNIPQPDL
jgi:hypothetical protein